MTPSLPQSITIFIIHMPFSIAEWLAGLALDLSRLSK